MANRLTVGSLFSGIGGFDLGFERAGLTCKWQVEIDEYARRVLQKHWPNVPKWDDIRTFPPASGEWGVDLIAGGFPCQDLSLAGNREGLAGERSGLWWEFARVIRLLRPRFMLVENVPGLLAPPDDGIQAPIGCVLGELAKLGYYAEWQRIPASAFGSTQLRFRVFVVAYPQGNRMERLCLSAGSWAEKQGKTNAPRADCKLDADRRQRRARRASPLLQEREADGKDNAKSECSIGQGAEEVRDESGEWRPSGEPDRRDSPFVGQGWWSAEPQMVRMVYGVPRRLVRPAIRGLGNCVIPQIAEWIGRRILEASRNFAK